jgi:capsular exopolysaccharide synthesis family protein
MGLNTPLGMLYTTGGLGLAFFREYMNNTITNPDATEMAFNVPVLGTISRCDAKQQDIERIVLKEPLSPFAENYKALRTAVLAALHDRNGKAARIMITSSLAGEGKTSTSANLAMAMAQGELRVVLIDADLRKPRIHDIFALRGSSGLSTLLAATVTAAGVEKVLRAGPLPNLAILPAGKIPPNPSELLMSHRMDAILDILADRFDIILLDSPPVLAVEDSRILCRRLDGILLVTRAHQTTLEAAGRSLKLLNRIKAPMLGLVINALDQRKSEHYYHHQYYTAYRPERLPARGNADAGS